MATARRRSGLTSKGEERWLADFRDSEGDRRLRQFPTESEGSRFLM